MRKKQQEEREKLRRMQLDMQREVEERRKLQKEEEAKIRQEYIEKMKAATIIDDIDDKPTKKGGCTYLFQFASLILFSFLPGLALWSCVLVIVGRVTDHREDREQSFKEFM